MKSALLLLVLVSLCRGNSWFPPIWDDSCSFTREQTFECFRRYADTNKDGAVSQEEVDEVITKYAPGYIRFATWFTGTAEIMKKCDYDRNGILTARDWIMAKETCLPFKRNLCTMQWFCDRAASLQEKEKKLNN